MGEEAHEVDDHVVLLRVNRTQEDLQIGHKRPVSQLDMLKNFLAISLNVSSVVSIVLMNKIIFGQFNFNFGITLTIIHFVITSIILFGLSRVGLFQVKELPLASILGLCTSFCGFVVLTNLSLQYNSVAYYQMVKVLTTPIVAVIQYSVFRINMDRKIKLTLGLTCVGVLAATAKEVTVSATGSLIAFLSVLVTAVYQVLVGEKQKSLEADSLQLLYYQAPVSVLLLLCVCPFFDNVKDLVAFPFSFGLVTAVLVSAALAAMVNISTFLIIGRTSAITYNVVGHCKLCLVLLFGYLAFDHQELSLVNFLGIAVALMGIISYSYVKIVCK